MGAILDALESANPGADIALAILRALNADLATSQGDIRPDYRTQLAAAQLATQYLEGRPPEAPPRPPPARDDGEDLEAAMRRSPALREAIRKAVERAEGAAEPRRGPGRPRKEPPASPSAP